MHAESAAILVPSLLPVDVAEWVRDFVFAVRDDVAMPLFGAPSVGEFEALLEDCLAIGASHRCRWIAALAELPAHARAEFENDWLRPPPQGMLQQFQELASMLLGPERSFQLRRALALTFSDYAENVQNLAAKLQSSSNSARFFVELAHLHETAGPHDVLCIAWMMVLMGDVPAPAPEIAQAAASVLLEVTARRLGAMQAVMKDEIPDTCLVLNDRGTHKEWLEQHMMLMLPMILLLGFAADDAAIEQVMLSHHTDPEDERLAVLEICLAVRGDPEAALLRLEDRALKAGVLSVMSDRHGATIALTSVSAERS